MQETEEVDMYNIKIKNAIRSSSQKGIRSKK